MGRRIGQTLTDLANPENPNRAALAHLRRGLGRPLDYTLSRVGWLFRRVPESKEDVLLRCRPRRRTFRLGEG